MVVEIIVTQRMRNRQIEMLEWFASYESELTKLSITSLINSWEDFVGSEHPLSSKDFPFPTYTSDEFKALYQVDRAWQIFCDVTSRHNNMDGDLFFELIEWKQLVLEANKALTIFMRRGRFREN